MPGLGDTTAILARLRKQSKAMAAMADAAGGGEGRMVETTAFGRNPGALRMLSYLPEGMAAGAPLVVVLHGCTQRAEAYAEGAGWLTLAERYGFAVLAPEQTTANNFNRCFNWFEPQDAARGQGEAASIRAMVAHLVKAHGLDPRRVFVTGLSAGGAMTSVMLAAYPEVFAGGGIVAGLAYGVADNVQEALGAMFGGSAHKRDLAPLMRKALAEGARLPRVSIWHGDADHTVRPHNAVDVAQQWTAAHGLAAAPGEREILPGRTRTVWRSPATGEVVIESNLIQGMDHGTPLATGGPEGAGRAGPFLIETGVSSSLEILRFWGVAETRRAAPVAKPAKAATPAAPLHRPAEPRRQPQHAHAPHRSSIGSGVLSSVAAHVPRDVHNIIEKALRKAGLMG